MRLTSEENIEVVRFNDMDDSSLAQLYSTDIEYFSSDVFFLDNSMNNVVIAYLALNSGNSINIRPFRLSVSQENNIDCRPYLKLNSADNSDILPFHDPLCNDPDNLSINKMNATVLRMSYCCDSGGHKEQRQVFVRCLLP